MAPVIELKGVSKSFGDKLIYKSMDLAVEEGETFTIIGGSGMGKSVCLKLMIGLLMADEGQVLYRGKEVAEMNGEDLRKLRRDVTMVFQGGALFDSMDVYENVAYALREHTKMDEKSILQRVQECLHMVGLESDEESLQKMPASLSGGMRKRVALARSIAIQPSVILYDEPTTGLDPANINRIGAMIKKLQRELHVTSIVVTHDMPTAFDVSNRIAMLWDYRFPYLGTPEEIRNSPAPEVQDFIQGRID